MASDGRIVFGVDLDGCVANICDGYRFGLATELGIDPALLGPVTDYYFNCWKPHLVDGDHYRALHNRLVADGLFANLQPIPDAISSLQRLHDDGIHIRIITHRTGPDPYDVVGQTCDWLRQHGAPFDGLCFEGNKTDIRCDIAIDDAPHHLAAYNTAAVPAIAYCAPKEGLYNRDAPGVHTTSWVTVEHLVRDHGRYRFGA